VIVDVFKEIAVVGFMQLLNAYQTGSPRTKEILDAAVRDYFAPDTAVFRRLQAQIQVSKILFPDDEEL
jgi:hypothetical protein